MRHLGFFKHIPLPIIGIVACSLLALHGTGIFATSSAAALLCCEVWYISKLIISITKNFTERYIIVTASIVSIITYALLFRYINGLELWVDEIQVIRFGQLPLSRIAQTVLHEHVAVPPLDYWNMWAWNKIASMFPTSVLEFVYRVPYMIAHTLSSIFIVLAYRSVGKKISIFSEIFCVSIVYILYFFNPWLFTYSYEVRYYGPMLLGCAIVVYLYYHDALFDTHNISLQLIFALCSTYHFLILTPFIVLGLLSPRHRIKAVQLLLGTLSLGLIILPFVYIPTAMPQTIAIHRIRESLIYLFFFYFDTVWKQIIVLGLTVCSIFLRKKGLLLLGISAIGMYVVSLLNLRVNYEFFGAKHYLFVFPLFTIAISETMQFRRFAHFSIIAGVAIIALFIPTFYYRLHNMYAQGISLSKSPMGLKYIFERSTQQKSNIIVEYGNANDSDISYAKKAISWYADHYPEIHVREYVLGEGCRYYLTQPSGTLYSIPQADICAGISSGPIEPYGAHVIFHNAQSK